MSHRLTEQLLENYFQVIISRASLSPRRVVIRAHPLIL